MRHRRPAKSTIIGQGMEGSHLHLLKSGEVRVLWREGPGCPSYELATLYQAAYPEGFTARLAGEDEARG